MLAAASPRPDSLSLVRLILSLLEDDAREVPDKLKEHLLTVLQQAITLAANSETIDRRVLPEAIELALEIKTSNAKGADALMLELGRVTSAQSINPDFARRLLHRITGDAIQQA